MIRWGSATHSPTIRILLVCLGITAVHLVFRLTASNASAASVQVSQLPLGATVAVSELPAGGASDASCRMLVSFSPDCPFCKLAADRERDGARSAPFASVTWITDMDAPSLPTFVQQLSPRSSYIVNSDVFRELDVRAVP